MIGNKLIGKSPANKKTVMCICQLATHVSCCCFIRNTFVRFATAFVRIRNGFARILKHFSSIHKVSFFFLTNHIIFGDFSANFKCVSDFHIRKDIHPGIRAALEYSPKCKSSITYLRNIFQISQKPRERSRKCLRIPANVWRSPLRFC